MKTLNNEHNIRSVFQFAKRALTHEMQSADLSDEGKEWRGDLLVLADKIEKEYLMLRHFAKMLDEVKP